MGKGKRIGATLPLERIQQSILLLRAHKVMLDFDLAALYGVQTKILNKAVKRNLQRFPADLMFELSDAEFENLRFQFGTSRWGGRRYRPYAFSEQGVAMLSSVLRSERAVLVNIEIGAQAGGAREEIRCAVQGRFRCNPGADGAGDPGEARHRFRPMESEAIAYKDFPVTDAEELEAVMRYHERTKHHFNRFAPGPGGLDWANQPDPFRRYAEAPLTRLPILKADEEPLSPRYDSLYAPGAVASVPMSIRALSRLLEYALALSAWKQAGGTRWALRVNPSSGNLHPTEGYVLIGGIAELGGTPGLFHYAPAEHGLERRADCPPALFGRLMRGLPPQAFLVGLSSVYWREAWKYGERAFRYCQHDAGHAIGTVRIAAATLGWSARVLDDVADATIEALLGLDRDADFEGAERESAELLMAMWPGDAAAVPL